MSTRIDRAFRIRLMVAAALAGVVMACGVGSTAIGPASGGTPTHTAAAGTPAGSGTTTPSLGKPAPTAGSAKPTPTTAPIKPTPTPTPPPKGLVGATAVVSTWTTGTSYTAGATVDAFTRGTNGHLYVNERDNTSAQGTWHDLGSAPNGVAVSSDPWAVLVNGNLGGFSIGSGPSFAAYVRGSDGHVYMNGGTAFSDLSTTRTWTDLSAPPGASVVGRPSVALSPVELTYPVLVRGSNGHLFFGHINTSGPVGWEWVDLGTPSGATLSSDPAAIYYAGRGYYTFLRGSNGHLYSSYGNNPQWSWSDQGAPPGTTVVGQPAVIVSPFHGFNRIYVFVHGANGHLLVNFWDGAHWIWADQGTAAGQTVGGDPTATTYVGEDLFVFMRGANGHLLVNYWNGTQWQWVDRGVPSRVAVAGAPMAAEVPVSGVLQLWAFATGANAHLEFISSPTWGWLDLGSPVP